MAKEKSMMQPPKMLLRFIFILLVLTLSFNLVTAQNNNEDELAPGDPRHLLTLLSFVPDTLENRQQLVTFTDTAAALAARPAAGSYASVAEWLEDDSDRAGLFLSTLVLPAPIAQFVRIQESAPALVGFDIFDAERALEFGAPPAHVLILQGSFDSQMIIAAHRLRDYTVEPLEMTDRDAILLCGSDDCDGMEISIITRDPANPFGGELGRRQPVVVVGDDTVYSSPSLEAVQAVTAAASSERPSLADSADYQAVVTALQSDNLGLLRQALITHGTTLGAQPGDSALVNPPSEALTALPPYLLVAFADMASEDAQFAVIALVYTTEQAAQTAIDAIPERLAAMQSLVQPRPWMALLEERGMTLEGAQVIANDDESRFVALLPFHYDLPSDERDESGFFTMSGLGYRLFLNAIYRRDTGWLDFGSEG
jgi:hypothetical protein